MGEFYQTFREESTPEGRIFLNSFYKASLTLIPKPDRESHKKGDHRPISLMHIDTKIFKKILANQIQQYIEKIIYHDH